MFAGFKLTNEDIRLLPLPSHQSAVVKATRDNDRDTLRTKIESFFSNDGSIDAAKMQEAWFPVLPRHVFISHSHADTVLAGRFASWLQSHLSITSFIDSSVWGFSHELLKNLDNDYCRKESGSYDYERRNVSTAHVHALLTVALVKMLDECECIIFLNTPNSIKPKDSIEAGETTASPWIFSELSLSALVRRRSRRLHRGELVEALESHSASRKADFRVDYPAPQEHLVRLSATKLLALNASRHANISLDAIYRSHGVATG